MTKTGEQAAIKEIGEKEEEEEDGEFGAFFNIHWIKVVEKDDKEYELAKLVEGKNINHHEVYENGKLKEMKLEDHGKIYVKLEGKKYVYKHFDLEP